MGADLQARWHRSIAEIPQPAWQALVAPHDLPHFSWDWLYCLEISGTVAPRHGWQSCHLGLWRHKELIAVAPLYLKAHSYGEFVFDQAFAQVAGQLGLEYYPKLLGMSPLTPALGYRFFMAPGEDQRSMTRLMFKLVDDLCRRNGILSANFLYAAADWAVLAEQAGCATWLQPRSEWRRTGERHFTDYLARFNANQRRNIKRERRAVAQAGISLTPMAGEEIPPGMLQQMHGFYSAHCARWGPWGSKYLTEDFFRLAEQRLRRHLALFSAHEGDPLAPVAMSLCLRNDHQLWGRYWGSDVEVSGLHFETCYYTPIAWALEQGIEQFDPGAGGSHKQRRGFRAEPFSCLHRWLDPTLDQLLRSWLPPANRRLVAQINVLNNRLPLQSPS
ncbi:MAG: GNAT family N-acetyltransferase [Cyanobacteria bacterium MAG APA_bin_95]|nr:GNAT family N-acetyltransferase [Cyanobacteria bacterium MAG APA_bin_95]